MTAPASLAAFQWAVAARPKEGQVTSGDSYRVAHGDDGSVLVVVVDGIGHGPDARAAAETVLDAFVGDAGVHPTTAAALEKRLERAHHAGRRTRGCVLSAAVVHGDALAWIGVGNVEGVVRRAASGGARDRLLTLGGIVGERLPNARARPLPFPFAHGDALIFATDGAPGAVLDETVSFDEPQKAADALLDKHAKGADDALVFVGVRVSHVSHVSHGGGANG